MALSINTFSSSLIIIKGMPADFITGMISETAMASSADKLALYGGTASDAFKAIVAKFKDALIPIGGYCVMERSGTKSTFPITVVNMPANSPFTDAGTHNKFQYIAQAIANKPKFSNYLYLIFFNTGAI